MKASKFSPFQTSSLDGGSTTLDRIMSDVKAALDDLANRMLGNATEDGGVWTITVGRSTPKGRPPVGAYYLWIDPSDGKLRTRGSAGTDTVIGSP